MIENTVTCANRVLQLNGAMNNDLDQLNNHPKGDGVEITGIIRKNVRVNLTDDEVIGLAPNGKDLLYKSDDPGEMYKSNKNKQEELIQSLLEQTPVEDRYFLQKQTRVEGYNKQLKKFRGGFCFGSEPIIVKRFKNEDGKWVTRKNLNKYQALTRVNFFFWSKKNGEDISIELCFEPGETFYAPKVCEDKEQRKAMLKDKKTK